MESERKMSLIPNKVYKSKIVIGQMKNVNSSKEFVSRFQQCFPLIWYRIQCYHDMDMKDEEKRKFERIPEPAVYVEHLYDDVKKILVTR